MAKQTTTSPFRTVAGSYEAPVEGIVDYGAFGRGFDKGLGDLSKIRQLRDEKVDDYKLAEFNVDEGNNFTGGEPIYKDEGGVLLQSEWAKTSNPTYREGDREKKQRLEQNVGQMNIYTNNKGLVFNALGDEQLHDSNFNPPVINEYGEKIEDVTWADINRVHKKYSASQNRRAGFKEVIRDGKVIGEKSGEFMTINGKEIFINYEDMTQKWINSNFKLNYSHEASLSTNKPEDFTNKVDAGQMLEKKYDQQTIVNGRVIESGSTTNTISDDWYIDTESKMNLAVDKVFNFENGVMGDGYSSAFRQFMDQDFELSPETIQNFKERGLSITNANQLKSYSELVLNLTKAEKVNMLRDWWTQSSLITTASIGYDRDVDQQLEKKDYTDNEISSGFAVRGDKTIKLFEKDGKLFKKGTNRAKRNPIKIDTRYKVKPEDVEVVPPAGPSSQDLVMDDLYNYASTTNSITYNYTNSKSDSFVKLDEEAEIDLKELGDGFFTDKDGTQVSLINGVVSNEDGKHFLTVNWSDGAKRNSEKFPLTQQGRARIALRVFEGKSRTPEEQKIADRIITQERSGEQKGGVLMQNREAVNKQFGEAGKAITMNRRLNVMRNYKTDPEVWNTLTDEDKMLLGDFDSSGNYKNNSELAKEYRKFLREN